MDKDLKEKLTSTQKWFRALFMILFGAISYLLQIVVWIIATFQFVYSLFTSRPNKNLLNFSKGLCEYYCQILNYLTYGHEVKPFPFSDWPKTVEKKPAKIAAKTAKPKK